MKTHLRFLLTGLVSLWLLIPGLLLVTALTSVSSQAGPSGAVPLPELPERSATLRVLSVERLPENRLSLLFHEAGNEVLDYRLSHQAALEAGTTSYLDLQARIVDLGDGYFQTIIPMPPASQRFYRIVGFGGPDTDGDGLSDALERLIGTCPNTFDTDGDGYGDGLELLYGSDPLDPNSTPLIILANFAETSSVAREDDGVIELAVTFDRNYNGPLHYRIAGISTAVPGEDFVPVTGTVTVNGDAAVIPITLLDDTRVDPVKVLAVDLVADPWGEYLVGGASRHIVQIHDNDTYWSGVMGTTDSSQLGFRLRMARLGSQVVSAAIISEPVAGGSQGTGTIPPGEWPVRITLGADSFHAVSDPIPMGTSLLTGDARLQRTITLTAMVGVEDYRLSANIIAGTFTDRLQSADPGMDWVDGSVSGGFVLMEDLPLPPESPGATGLSGPAVSRARGGGQ